jgi:hypothetical protein
MYYTDDGGNFNITDDDQMLATLAYPFTVSASACPNITSMVETITVATTMAGCGGTSCHANGTNGTTGGGGKLILALDKP